MLFTIHANYELAGSLPLLKFEFISFIVVVVALVINFLSKSLHAHNVDNDFPRNPPIE